MIKRVEEQEAKKSYLRQSARLSPNNPQMMKLVSL